MIDDKTLLARISKIKAIARRLGYPEYKAEEISQQAALYILESPSNCKTQKNYYLFIDAIRIGIERTFDRQGRFVRPIFESQLGNKASLIYGASANTDVEQALSDKESYRHLNECIEDLESEDDKTITRLYIINELKKAQIAKLFEVSESRISQRYSHIRRKLCSIAKKKGFNMNCLPTNLKMNRMEMKTPSPPPGPTIVPPVSVFSMDDSKLDFSLDIQPKEVVVKDTDTKRINEWLDACEATFKCLDEGVNFNEIVDRFENIIIKATLDRTKWNRAQASFLLKLNRTTLVEKLKKKQLFHSNIDPVHADNHSLVNG